MYLIPTSCRSVQPVPSPAPSPASLPLQPIWTPNPNTIIDAIARVPNKFIKVLCAASAQSYWESQHCCLFMARVLPGRYKYFPPFLLPPSSSFLLHPTPTHSHTPTTTHTLVRPIHPTPSHLPTALSHAHFIFSPPLDGALMASDAVGALTADRASRRVSSALPMRPLHSNSPVLSCTSSPSAIYLTGLLPAALKRTHC